MSIFRMQLPDVGEGVAEAELVEWFVAVGDDVTPESVLAAVLTDKATVEVSAPVAGVVTTLHGEPGDILAVGSDLVEIETEGDAAEPADHESHAEELPPPDVASSEETAPDVADPVADEGDSVALDDDPDREPTQRPRPTAAPAVRARARSLGIDLTTVAGTGPDGRVVHADLDRLLTERTTPARLPVDDEGVTHPVRGVRRRIAHRLTEAWQEIPHITYVEAVDVTELERLRAELNQQSEARGVRLTLLSFLATAMTIACSEQPGLSAHYDHAGEVLTTFDAVHVGIATQTDDGLLVPVVRHAESRGLWDLATEIARVTTAARDGSATRDELSGSTITITSLGAIGGVATTPILNAPEVAIIGVNKIETRPVWEEGSVVPRQVLHLSSSFDHRMVDGWDAATYVQRLKTLLETPSLLFVEG